jgi:hypothetical protein
MTRVMGADKLYKWIALTYKDKNGARGLALKKKLPMAGITFPQQFLFTYSNRRFNEKTRRNNKSKYLTDKILLQLIIYSLTCIDKSHACTACFLSM